MTTPSSIRRILRNLSIPRKSSLIIGLFSAVVAALLVASYFGMDILSSDRAFVGGEGLWSKGQKEAVMHLGRYASSHDEKDYQKYLSALQIPLGDHQARVELEKPHPDLTIATTGFLRGGNHLQDIPGMIHLFRRFRRIGYVNRAIEIWAEGDRYLAQLEDVGTEIHREVTAKRGSPERLQSLLAKAQEINAQLTPLENAFSFTLGEGARWLKNVLLTFMILATCLFLGLTISMALMISNELCEDIDHLREGASRIARGDYSLSLNVEAKDEIGDLARSFQEMADQRRQVEDVRDSLIAHVTSANQELEAFSYSVSHDLRAPLRAIDGFTLQLLRNSEGILDERSKADLKRVRAATERMAQLIEDLLELARLSRSELKRTDVDLSALVKDIVKDLRASDPQRSVNWVVAPHAMCQGDAHLLRVALENLLQNSWKFTKHQPAPRIEFGVTSREGKPIFIVRDNGVGFNMAYVDKLFKAFQRLHDSSEFPGTGIGLALVDRIIRRHGGAIWVESEENRGTTFYFTLPQTLKTHIAKGVAA